MRFIAERYKSEIINLYHTARIAGAVSCYERMLWTVNEFHKLHPEYPKGYIYKDLDEVLSYETDISGEAIAVHCG